MGNAYKEVTPEMIKEAEAMAARGMDIEQIAHCLGLGYSTIYEKQKDYPELKEAIKRGQAAGIRAVTNALFKNAIGGNNTTAQLFYLKCKARWREEDKQVDADDTLKKAKDDVEKIKQDENGRSTQSKS